MKKRKFPKVLQLYLGASTPEGFGERFYREIIVWTDTDFESYKSHNQKYIQKERSIKWRDLKGKNFFSRVYYTFPIGITYSIGVVIGYGLGHIDTFIKYGKELYRIIYP